MRGMPGPAVTFAALIVFNPPKNYLGFPGLSR